MKNIIVLLFLSVLIGCNDEPDPISPNPVVPSNVEGTPLWEIRDEKNVVWSNYLREIIPERGPDLLRVVPSDHSDFMKGDFSKLSTEERIEFWVLLFSAMAQRESNFNTSLTYQENFRDRHGEYIISRGLLQLSIESSLGYGCPLNSANDLHDPFKNLECSVMIMNRWVQRDERIAGRVGGEWRGGARYWSVLRSINSSPYSFIVSSMKEVY